MPQHVLVPLDGSTHGFAGLEYAIASFPDASITAVYVVDPSREYVGELDSPESPMAELEARARRVLDRAAERAADAGVECRTMVRTGSPHTELLGVAVEADVDQIVMGSHGESPITRPFLGHVSEAVVRRAPVSTTIVPATLEEIRQRELPGRVLVPVDGSEQAEAALAYALETFRDGDHTVVHVLELTLDRPPEAVRGTYLEAVLDDLEERGAEILTSATTLADELGASVTTETVIGSPATEIVDYADANDYDQIVMGSHGRSLGARLFTGSVAERVARRSPLSVTLVRGAPADE